MEYKNLSELIENEKSGRSYYNSLPRYVQAELCVAGETIHTTAELHCMARSAGERYRRSILLKKDYD